MSNFYPALYQGAIKSIYTGMCIHSHLSFNLYQCLLVLAEKPGYVLHLCGSHLVLGGPMLPRILSIKLQPPSRANFGDGCQWIRLLCLQHTLQELCSYTHSSKTVLIADFYWHNFILILNLPTQ